MTKPVYYNEFDKNAAAWLRELMKHNLIAPGVVDERSIEDVLPSDLAGFAQHHFFAGIGGWPLALRLAGWPDDRPIWTGSCPCQPFSQAGQGTGFADERHLWPAFYHLIRVYGPGVVGGEQSASYDANPWVDLVQTDLEALDYAFGAVAFPSASVGAPHIRDRTYWLAHAASAGSQGSADSWRARTARLDGGALERSGQALRLADAGRFGGGPQAAPAGDWQPQADGPADRDRGRGLPSGGLANAAGVGLDARLGSGSGCDHREGQEAGPGPGGGWLPGGLGHADGIGAGRDAGAVRQAQAGEGGRLGGNDAGAPGPADRPGPTNGFWREADWLFCRDQKWRPVDPGTFPLGDGIPGRVALLRGAGNAVNPHQAAAFIKAYINYLQGN